MDALHVDHDTILVPWGTADIFFPTDFQQLNALYRHAADHAAVQNQAPAVVDARHASSKEFLQQLADMKQTATLSGYNPLIEDFQNTRIFLGASGKATVPPSKAKRRR